MQVKIITDKENTTCSVKVVQKNKNPIVFKPFCEYNEKFNAIFVSVPSCISSVASQFGGNNWEEFVNAYVCSINKAIKLGAKTVLVPELGENLLWKDCLIAMAARESLGKLDLCDDAFTIVFFVSEDRYKLWDEMMKFD